MVAHNADFDMSFILADCKRRGPTATLPTSTRWLWPVSSCRIWSRYKLTMWRRLLASSLEHHHRAVDDAECTAQHL